MQALPVALTLTCVSFSCSEVAISMRLARVRYLLKWNSFSSSVSCFVVKLVRPVLLLAALLPPAAPRLDGEEPLTAAMLFKEPAEFGEPPP